jgi:hypothetical protein
MSVELESWDSDCRYTANSSEPDSLNPLWDVQEILAERSSVVAGKELLVVWKTSWIPKRNMISDGPVMRKWIESRKSKFRQGLDHITLAVEPGSSLAMDCDLRSAEKHLKQTHPGRPAAEPTAAAATQLNVAPSPVAKAAKPTTKRRKTG